MKAGAIGRCIRFFLLFTFVLSITLSNAASAATASATSLLPSLPIDQSYFYSYTNGVHSSMANGNAGYLFAGGIVGDSVGSVSAFKTWIKDKLYWGPLTETERINKGYDLPTFRRKAAESTSASFIIQTMRYALDSSVDYDRDNTATADDVSNWETLLGGLSISQISIPSDKYNTKLIYKDGVDLSTRKMYDIMPYAKSDTYTKYNTTGTAFSKDGIIKYIIENACGNVIWNTSLSHGGRSVETTLSVNGLEHPGATDSAHYPSALPGDQVNWKHEIDLSGTYINRKLNYKLKQQNWPSGVLYSSIFSGTEVIVKQKIINWGIYRSALDRNSSTVKQTDVGKTICQGIWANQVGWGAIPEALSFPAESEWPCVNIPYKYELVPYITSLDFSAGEVLEPGKTLQLRPSVKNNGPTKSRVATWTFSSNANYVSGTTGGNVVVLTPPSPVTVNYGIINYTVPDLPVGSDVCFYMSVTPNTQIGGTANAQLCAKIGKRPKVQVWGGDVLAQGGVAGSTSGFIKTSTGSYSEYGLFAKKKISNMMSAFGHKLNAKCELNGRHYLSFNNNVCINVGNYSFGGDGHPYDNIIAKITDTSSPVNPHGSGDDNDIKDGITITEGTRVIKALGGTVNITGDIITGVPTNLNDLPQVIIIANNINIASNVSRIDAWLVTPGAVNTCSSTIVGECQLPLKINGPVVANKILMRRTYSDINSNPAEIFNLRAEALPWSVQYLNKIDSSSSKRLKIRSIKELPPRL